MTSGQFTYLAQLGYNGSMDDKLVAYYQDLINGAGYISSTSLDIASPAANAVYVWDAVAHKLSPAAKTPTLTSGFSEAHIVYNPPATGWSGISAVRPIHLDALYLATDQPIVSPAAQGNSYQGITSTIIDGDNTHAAIGTTHAFSARHIIANSGAALNEPAAYFGFIQTNSTTTPGRVWFTDFNVHSAIGVQHDALAGVTMFMNNYYNGSPANTNNPSGNFWAVTHPGMGGGGTAAHNAAQSYPMDVGVGIVGTSGTVDNTTVVTPGFTVGLKIGGVGSNWAANSLIGTGCEIRDYQSYGLHFTHRAASAATTAPALVVDTGVGYVGVGTQTSDVPRALFEVNGQGGTGVVDSAAATHAIGSTASRFIVDSGGNALLLEGYSAGVTGANLAVYMAMSRGKFGYDGSNVVINDFSAVTAAAANKDFSLNFGGAERMHVYSTAVSAGVSVAGAVRFAAGRVIMGSANSHVYGDATSVAARLATTTPSGSFLVQNEDGSATYLTTTATGTKIGGSIGFYNTAPVSKPTVTGSKAANAALTSLLTALASLGLVTDSST